MHRSVGLYSLVVNPKTGRKQYASCLTRSGRPLPEGFARLGAKQLRHNGHYYLRVGNSCTRAGTSFQKALEARRAEEHRLAHLRLGSSDLLPSDDISQATRRWVRDRGPSRYWVRQSERVLEDFARHCDQAGVTRLSQVSRDLILSYVERRRSDGQKNSTMESVLRRVISLLHDNDFPSPLKRRDWPRPDRKVVNPPTEAEMLAILANAASDDGRLILATYIMTGMRHRELLHCCYGDFDEGRRTLAVSDKTEAHPHGPWRAKTVNGVRTIPIPLLVDRLSQRRRLRGAADTHLIFPGRGGKPYFNIGHKLAAACRRAAIRPLKIKDFRDGFSKRLWVEARLDKAKVKILLGHGAEDVTEKHYLPRDLGHTEECQEAARRAFGFLEDRF